MYLCRTCQQQSYESGDTFYCPQCDNIGVAVDEVGDDYEDRFGSTETMPDGGIAKAFRRVFDKLD